MSEFRTPEDEPILSSDDPSEPVEGELHEDLGGSAEDGGEAGGGSGDGETDPELKDSGPPADGTAEPGSSGAEEGINPWHPEAYDEDPSGPTVSTED